MTREEIKQICQIYDNLRTERNAATIAYNSDDVFWEHVLATYKLFQPSLPSNLDEAAKQLYPIITEEAKSDEWKIANREYNDMCIKLQDAFRKGAEWMAGQGEKEIVMDKHIPERIFLWKSEMNEFLNGERKQVQIGINQDNLPGLLTYVLWKDVSQKVEQPEVDLEKEIDKEWAKCEPIGEGMGLESANIVNEQFDSIASHFYELGLKAKNMRHRKID